MDANLKCEEIDNPYQYMGSYFEFLRDNIKTRSRNYYVNMLDGLSLVRPPLFESAGRVRSGGPDQALDFAADEGHPVYLIICLFGPHDPHPGQPHTSSSLPLSQEDFDRPSPASHESAAREEFEQPSVTEQLVKIIGDLMLNFMIITPCLDLVKKEKIAQFVQSAKRSLLVDFEVHKHKLKELLSDFIN